MSKPAEFIEIDRGGERFTRFTYGHAGDETCLRQPYMTDRVWLEKLTEFLGRQDAGIPVYDDRHRTNELLGTAGGFLVEFQCELATIPAGAGYAA